MKLVLIITVSLINACLTLDEEIIINFLHQNGFKLVTFYGCSLLQISWLKLASRNGIQVRFVQKFEPMIDDHLDFLVIELLDNDLDSALTLIKNHKVGKSLLLSKNNVIEKLKLKLEKSNRYQGLFYVNEAEKWKQVLIINNQMAVNNVYFDGQGRAKVKENLQGMKLETTTLTWDPFIVVENCNLNDGRNCQVLEGALVDLANEWSSALNFTWSVVQDDDVGTLPKSGKLKE